MKPNKISTFVDVTNLGCDLLILISCNFTEYSVRYRFNSRLTFDINCFTSLTVLRLVIDLLLFPKLIYPKITINYFLSFILCLKSYEISNVTGYCLKIELPLPLLAIIKWVCPSSCTDILK